jgi:hypothetical protein
MFEFAWPWIFVLVPLPWLMRLVLPVADSGEPALKVSFLADLEGLARRRARANLAGVASTGAVHAVVAVAADRRRAPAMARRAAADCRQWP